MDKPEYTRLVYLGLLSQRNTFQLENSNIRISVFFFILG